MKMKRILFCIIIISFILISNFAFSATFTISTSNFPNPSFVENFVMNFNVSNDFQYTADSEVFGPAIPAPINPSFPWGLFQNPPVVAGNVLTIDLFNSEIFDIIGGFDPNPLGNGIVTTFDFIGTVDSIASFSFFDVDGALVPYHDQITSEFTPTTANFNAVPIPGSILLLGSGLVGLIGIARRKRS